MSINRELVTAAMSEPTPSWCPSAASHRGRLARGRVSDVGADVARLVVTVQMILDLGVLGRGLRVFLGAGQRGRQQHTAQQETKTD